MVILTVKLCNGTKSLATLSFCQVWKMKIIYPAMKVWGFSAKILVLNEFLLPLLVLVLSKPTETILSQSKSSLLKTSLMVVKSVSALEQSSRDVEHME